MDMTAKEIYAQNARDARKTGARNYRLSKTAQTVSDREKFREEANKAYAMAEYFEALAK